MMNPFNFAKVPPLYLGQGKLQLLPQLMQSYGRGESLRVLWVTGKSSLQKSGQEARVESLLGQGGEVVGRVFCEQEPTTEWIDHCCETYRPQQINLVVGIGGGSVIDAGKAISAMLPHENSIFDHLEGVGKGIPHSGIKVPYLAIPTTSGTGSEATKNAVISQVGPQGYKKSLRHDHLIPDGVIIDGDLLTSCPPEITASCGMDAFTQLLEPYLSPTASPLSDVLAWSGLKIISRNLLKACGEGAQDPQVRESMAYASFLSGVALANAGLGIVHALASPLGGYFPIPHGVICGTLMAAAVRVNWQALQNRDPHHPAVGKMVQLGQWMSQEEGKSPGYYGDFLVQELENWTEQLKIPRLGEYGVTEGDLGRILAQTTNRNNPIALNFGEIQELLQARL
ncbi:iron-containing alcohol dehydrogenase [Spirulina subsalsa]|uniref:iron-containing alcohol dehydrogenase n=1 Tax=Spirulina subsalsa TaxID=54311 RepID=UPI00035FC173|nr:iron-containing alcohol dehydrogenase [Spirulina subsalsa]